MRGGLTGLGAAGDGTPARSLPSLTTGRFHREGISALLKGENSACTANPGLLANVCLFISLRQLRAGARDPSPAGDTGHLCPCKEFTQAYSG